MKIYLTSKNKWGRGRHATSACECVWKLERIWLFNFNTATDRIFIICSSFLKGCIIFRGNQKYNKKYIIKTLGVQHHFVKKNYWKSPFNIIIIIIILCLKGIIKLRYHIFNQNFIFNCDLNTSDIDNITLKDIFWTDLLKFFFELKTKEKIPLNVDSIIWYN